MYLIDHQEVGMSQQLQHANLTLHFGSIVGLMGSHNLHCDLLVLLVMALGDATREEVGYRGE